MAEVPAESPEPVQGAVVPPKTDRIRITAEAVEFLSNSSIVAMTPRDSTSLELQLASPAPHGALQRAVDLSQQALVENVSNALKSSMTRVGSSFDWYLRMNVALFIVGLGSFVVAVIKGLANPGTSDAIVSAAFGGLSGVTFLAYFISRPLAAVASAGPEAAWLLGTVNTYWTKLIYLNNPSTFVTEIQAAQEDFEESMGLLLKTFDYLDRAKPADVKAAQEVEAAWKKTAAKKTAAKKAAPKKAAVKKTAAKKVAVSHEGATVLRASNGERGTL